jgi:hypothetical protein
MCPLCLFYRQVDHAVADHATAQPCGHSFKEPASIRGRQRRCGAHHGIKLVIAERDRLCMLADWHHAAPMSE